MDNFIIGFVSSIIGAVVTIFLIRNAKKLDTSAKTQQEIVDLLREIATLLKSNKENK